MPPWRWRRTGPPFIRLWRRQAGLEAPAHPATRLRGHVGRSSRRGATGFAPPLKAARAAGVEDGPTLSPPPQQRCCHRHRLWRTDIACQSSDCKERGISFCGGGLVCVGAAENRSRFSFPGLVHFDHFKVSFNHYKRIVHVKPRRSVPLASLLATWSPPKP